jgi:hypothetical protein
MKSAEEAPARAMKSRRHALTDEEEEQVYRSVMSKREGSTPSPVPVDRIINLAKSLFNKDVGGHYARSFMKRWHLSTHAIVWRQGGSSAAGATNKSMEESLCEFVYDIRYLRMKHRWPAGHILNVDESWFSLCPRPKRTVDEVGKKEVRTALRKLPVL